MFSRRSVLLVQSLVIWLFERFVEIQLKYMSAYGTEQTGTYFPVFLIPLVLFVSTFLSEKFRPALYSVAPFLLLGDFAAAALVWSVAVSVFILSNLWKKSGVFTIVLLAFSLGSIAASNLKVTANLPLYLSWFWLIVHVSWGLKAISWIVTVRVYGRKFAWNECLDFFFNPVFFFFTNDLNVLTPDRFLNSRNAAVFGRTDFLRSLKLTGYGLAALLAYGAFQKFYFLNLDNVGWASSAVFGGLVSIVVAILFHAANIFLQVSLLQPMGYQLAVDMNRPWLANSPQDYWRRMHFYVREYVFDIIVKPVMTALARRGFSVSESRLSLVSALYFVFTCTQIGYQPFRQYRTLEISALVTAVFVAMIALPELLHPSHRRKLFVENTVVGKVMTFSILGLGYALIFYLRRGF